jgi:purine-binding chemotaxis protein CheW
MVHRLHEDDSALASTLAPAQSSIFAIHGDLDGEQRGEFQEREQFIGLIIGPEEFLLPIAAVREIIMLPPITFVPNCQEFVDGVINLRGTILPALNMRKMMAFPRGEATKDARVIIVRHEGVTFGLIVDGITYVVALLPSEIETQSLPGKGTGAEFIAQVAKHGRKVCGILDLQRVLKQAGDVLADAVEDGAGDVKRDEAA